MSDKTRYYARKALIDSRMAKERARQAGELPLPRCLCGLTWHEVPAMWDVSGYTGKRGAKPDFRCAGCLPIELRGLQTGLERQGPRCWSD